MCRANLEPVKAAVKRAISSPLEHMGAVLSASDLATTFVLLGEFSAAILTLLDSVLRRVERGPLARRNSPEIDF